MSERAIMARNARDLAKINMMHGAAERLLQSLAAIEPLEHPDSRWHPDDLRCALRGTLQGLAAERRRALEPLLTPDEVML